MSHPQSLRPGKKKTLGEQEEAERMTYRQEREDRNDTPGWPSYR